MKYLFDACTWRDFHEARYSDSGKPFGKYAAKLLMKIIDRRMIILVSEAVVKDLRKGYSYGDIEQMLSLLDNNGLIERIVTSEEEFYEADKLAADRDVPFTDALHAVQARNHKAVVVSQDMHFFFDLADIAEAARPQDLL